jgi:hypothetical protein
MNARERAALYRQRAAYFEAKASTARTDEMCRTWLILAREWCAMVQKDELKHHDSPPLASLLALTGANAEASE